MAAKTEKKEKGKEKSADAPKYSINDLSEKLNLTPASTRIKLRKAGIEKVGGRYGWETKAELNEVADTLNAQKEEKKPKKKNKDED